MIDIHAALHVIASIVMHTGILPQAATVTTGITQMDAGVVSTVIEVDLLITTDQTTGVEAVTNLIRFSKYICSKYLFKCEILSALLCFMRYQLYY